MRTDAIKADAVKAKASGGGGAGRIHSFGPVAGESPAVLILGSMPSALSLERRRYYGNERNHFWRLIHAVLEEPESGDYAAAVAMLERRKIALWDVMRSCVRPGSLDKNIRDEEPNDIAGLLAEKPTIRAVCFNGQAARTVYFKYNRGAEAGTAPEYLLLPSSSPVPRRTVKTFGDRLEKWLELRRFLRS
jgi:TDG/mug DNA glycosylase family protein